MTRGPCNRQRKESDQQQKRNDFDTIQSIDGEKEMKTYETIYEVQ